MFLNCTVCRPLTTHPSQEMFTELCIDLGSVPVKHCSLTGVCGCDKRASRDVISPSLRSQAPRRSLSPYAALCSTQRTPAGFRNVLRILPGFGHNANFLCGTEGDLKGLAAQQPLLGSEFSGPGLGANTAAIRESKPFRGCKIRHKETYTSPTVRHRKFSRSIT